MAIFGIIDAVVSQENLVQQIENTLSLFPLRTRRCLAILSAQNDRNHWDPYTHLLPREGWPEVAFMEELWLKSHIADIETNPSNSAMHKNIITGVWKK